MGVAEAPGRKEGPPAPPCPAPPGLSGGGDIGGPRLAGHNVPSLWSGVKETCPAGSWGHSRLVMDGPAWGQATKKHPCPPPSEVPERGPRTCHFSFPNTMGNLSSEPHDF